MQQDSKEKRAIFIDSSVKVREGFSFAHPFEQITAVEKYCTAVYGSNLWELGSNETNMLVNSWKTGLKLAWGVTRACRTYLVETVLAPHVRSLRARLLLRFINFFRALLTGPSREVTVVALLAARDKRSSIGANLAVVSELTKLDPWVSSIGELRNSLEEADRAKIPDRDEWRIPYLRKLLSALLEAKYSADSAEEERLQSLITSLVIN